MFSASSAPPHASGLNVIDCVPLTRAARRPPVTKADLKIAHGAREILNSSAKWNRSDNRVCPERAETFSLYCALERATNDAGDHFEHRSAAMQEARFVIEDVVPDWKKYDHRLMDSTTIPRPLSLTSKKCSAC